MEKKQKNRRNRNLTKR